MKPFSLSAVLKYRKQLEETAATRLAQAQKSKHLILSQFISIEKEYNTLVSDLAKNQSTGMDVDSLVRYEDRLFWLKDQIAKAAIQLEQADKKVQIERLNVLKRSREKKILEQLKKKQDKSWKNYLDKKETAQLDEIAVLSHERKRQDQ